MSIDSRIPDYGEFIVEGLILALNESDVRFSERFAELLMMVDSPISKALLELRDKDLPVKTNYFDLSKDGEHVSFLADAKAKQMERENKEVEVLIPSPVMSYHYRQLHDKLKFDRRAAHIPDHGEVGRVVRQVEWRDKVWLLLEFGGEGDESRQCVINKDHTKSTDTIMWKRNRQDIRVGRGIRALASSLGMQFTDAQVEDFVNKYKANYDRAMDAFRNFELVRGNKIAHFYHSDNYADPSKGDLGNSCMGEKPAWYFGVYTQNHMVCSLLILKSAAQSDKIVGRALVWNLRTPDITYMDRIYTNTPSQMQLFREYARAQGWHHKKDNNNMATGEAVGPDGKTVDLDTLEVRIKAMDYTAFPYVDTLKYLTKGRDEWVLSNEESTRSICLEDTHGRWVDDECEACSGTGRQGCDECDATGTVKCSGPCKGTGEVDGKVCPDCRGQRRVQCDECDGDGYVDCQECG